VFWVLVMAISGVAVCESWCVAGRYAGNEVGLLLIMMLSTDRCYLSNAALADSNYWRQCDGI
jgi:hypothetical protein